MKVLFLAGSHPRHMYIAKKLYDNQYLDGLLIEKRENFVPQPPEGLCDLDKNNFIRHFKDREESEAKFFGKITDVIFNDSVRKIKVNKEQLNSDKVKKWICDFNPDVVLSYGIHKLSNEFLSILPAYSFNIHGGLSPWFRGNITLFWPFYFLKPNWAGMTVHYLTERIDGGDIIHHSVPKLFKGDGVHDVACRAVIQVAEDLIAILKLIEEGKKLKGVPQGTLGKLFISSDWKPQHLRLIYNTFNNDIVDRFLDGELGYDEPKLVRAF